VATFNDEDNSKRLSKRLSGGSAMFKNFTRRSQQMKRLSNAMSISKEQLTMEPENDDRSSVAATMDDLTDDDDMMSVTQDTPIRSPVGQAFDSPMVEMESEVKDVETPHLDDDAEPATVKNAGSKIPEVEASTKNEVEGDAPTKSLTSSTDPKPEIENTIASKESDPEPASRSPSTRLVPDDKPASLTKAALPPAMSKIVLSYRTNEWAKHLSTAEAPEVDELRMAQFAEEDSVVEEVPAALNVVELQQTAETGQVAPEPRPLSRPASTHTPLHISRTNSMQSSIAPTMPSPAALPQAALLRAPSQQSSGLRSSSTPTILIPDSVTRDWSASAMPSPSQTLTQSPQALNIPFAQNAPSTLLGMRDTMIRAKSGSFSPLAPTAELQSLYSSNTSSRPGSTTGSRNAARLGADDENMSLSARREALRQSQQAGSLYGQQGQGVSPSASMGSLHSQNPYFKPQRQSSTPLPAQVRESQLASWRASVAADLRASVVPAKGIDQSRGALMAERAREERERNMDEMRRREREGAMDGLMRRGDMGDRHREAMRKLQGSAKVENV